MMKIFMIVLSLICLTKCQNCTCGTENISNNRPIIGILTQELEDDLESRYPRYSYGQAYIPASYVKFIEGAGARVVPIKIGQTNEYYQRILNNINGVLFPGGSASFDKSDGFADAGAKIYRFAKSMNTNGDYFPIFGICLGFELLTYTAANQVELRVGCDISREALPLEFAEISSSRMFQNASNEIIQILMHEKVTVNLHQYCITKRALKTVGLNQQFRINSYNKDRNGLQFISSLEHVDYPFYGVQFHPEKNLYEWKLNYGIPHSFNAVQIGQYFANFFVNEARKSTHSLASSAEQEHLIYNYSPVYSALKGSEYQQIYLFSEQST